MKGFCLSLLVALACAFVVGHAYAGPVAYLDAFGEIYVTDNPKAVDAVSALSCLSSPPPSGPLAGILTSAVPRGTKLLDFRIDGDRAVVNFSKRLVAGGVEETRLSGVFEQVKWTLWNWGIDMNVSILVEGVPFSQWAVPTPVIEPRGDVGITSLSGRSITLSPGHGKFWNGSGWYTQRPVYCSPLNEEDYHNLEICQYIETYLLNDAMTVKMVRCTNKNYGNNPYTGDPWWKMAACYWLKNIGYPCSVYGSYSGCSLGDGGSESSDDIRSRPLASDYDNTNIYVSLHTNGYQGDCTGAGCPTGTITYYDCSSEHASWCTVSQNLANAVHGALIDTIRNKIPISDWTDRGKADSNGAYGEIRIPDRAAILIELAFHDTCDRDAVYLRDNFFRSACAWGIYKGICSYFGTTPTWDFYSDELVSHTIPSTMTTGETRQVSITFRNKGVLWTEAKQIRLGAVGDSDPFTTQTRQYISGEVGPNGTYTFTFNLTAPSTPGTYTTDWRMLRENVTWFGATCSVNVNVQAPTTEIIIDNSDAGFSASSNWSTGTMATDKYGTNYRYRSTAATSDVATWRPNIPSAGTWAVYAWWSAGTNRSPSSAYIVYYSGGSQSVTVNQQTNGGKWNLLTTKTFGTGTAYPTQKSCWATTGYVVIADAVKWVKQ